MLRRFCNTVSPYIVCHVHLSGSTVRGQIHYIIYNINEKNVFCYYACRYILHVSPCDVFLCAVPFLWCSALPLLTRVATVHAMYSTPFLCTGYIIVRYTHKKNKNIIMITCVRSMV